MNGSRVNAYQRTNVMTADPKRLVLMCYEGAISNLKFAKEKFESGEYEAKARAIQKFQDIVNELLCSLDFEKGGQIATNLSAIYDYMMRRILRADVDGELSAFDEVLGMLEELKEAWEEISNNKKRGSVEKAMFASSMTEQLDPRGLSATYGPPARL
ncbi:MAG: flagellar export chaperone FliS [Desulfobacterales bacterium S7086C20]|nr:MAG: flagellar export chaperone FliS [Desulfobacterales bacterium S7086C20]